MAEAASGGEKKKEKAAPRGKIGRIGRRSNEREERERTAYGCSLVNVFRAYYLLVVPYTTLAAPLPSRSMLLLLSFFFLDSIFLFFHDT